MSQSRTRRPADTGGQAAEPTAEPVNTESGPPEGWIQDDEGRWSPPADEPTGDADPEWTALLERARTGGDDAAQAVCDAYSRGVLVGVDRAAKETGAPTLTTDGVTTADTAALTGVTTGAKPAAPRRIVVSEGAWHDLARLGRVTDPGTGYELRLNRETREVTAHHRGTGKQADVPVVAPTDRAGD